MKRKKLKIISLAILLLVLLLGSWMYFISQYRPTLPQHKDFGKVNVTRIDSATFATGDSWLHEKKSGFWELYVEGAPLERGAKIGALCQPLIEKQENAFIEQIGELIPSRSYLNFLKYFIGFFNRGLGEAIPEEYKEEIIAISSFSSSEFNFIGTPYQRQMNYHAAHDIGHALQSMGMVGCTSFAAWGNHTQDSSLLIGRNFDFYVGDKFAEDKIIAFVNPDKGYKHMFVTWGGMIGVVSGMNEKGLTVTLNASNTEMPLKSATPVSIIGREILQYAKNIDEAVKIAKRRTSFVSEQFLIGSAQDGYAVVIEKTPKIMSVYKSGKNELISTNHFQTAELALTKEALRQRDETASGYRYVRVQELLDENQKLTPAAVAAILRDTKGKRGEDIGLGNEKAINQLIAHHSIIFAPQKKMVWISTSPFQLGEYIAYNLDSVFYGKQNNYHRLAQSGLNIAADSAFLKTQFSAFDKYRTLHKAFAKTGQLPVSPDSLIGLNSNYFLPYVDAGKYWFAKGDKEKAKQYYIKALQKEIATVKERNEIVDLIKECQND